MERVVEDDGVSLVALCGAEGLCAVRLAMAGGCALAATSGGPR